jgi:hypothetical protein
MTPPNLPCSGETYLHWSLDGDAEWRIEIECNGGDAGDCGWRVALDLDSTDGITSEELNDLDEAHYAHRDGLADDVDAA